MRKFFWILVILFVSVWAGVLISKDPGFALFGYRQWTVEMPLWFFFVATMLVILVIFSILKFFDGIETTWLRFTNWLRSRKKFRSINKTHKGVIELLEGNWQSAEHDLLSVVDRVDNPFINYLGAARAAHELGQYDKRDLYLQKAHQLMPSAEVAIGLMQADFQLSQGQLEPALATLKNLHKLEPKHPKVLRLLEKLYIRLADWDELLKLLPLLKKTKLITADQQDNFEAHIYQELLNQFSRKSKNVEELHEIWNKVPRKVKKNPDLILCYVKKLLSYPNTGKEVAEQIESVLKNQWNDELAYYYGLALTDQSKHQLAIAEDWLKQYGYHAMLFLTLGRLSLRCQLWGKARSYLEQSLKADPKAETYLEYGKLLEQLGEKDPAFDVYRQGLVKV